MTDAHISKSFAALSARDTFDKKIELDGIISQKDGWPTQSRDPLISEHFTRADSSDLGQRSARLAGFAADGLALVVAAVGAAALESWIQLPKSLPGQAFTFSTTLVRLFVCVPLLAVLLTGSGARWKLRISVGEQLRAVGPPLAIGGLISVAGWRLASITRVVDAPAPGAIALMCAIGLLTVPIVRLAGHSSPIRTRKHRRVLVVGSGVVADRVIFEMATQTGIDVVGLVDDDPSDPSQCRGKLCELAAVCERESINHVVVAFSRSPASEIVEALRPIQGQVAITIVPRLFDVLPANAKVHDLASGITGISVGPASFGWGPRLIKRTIDLVGSILTLLVLSPFLLLLGVAIRTTSKGPVIFRQTRIGQHGQPFSMFKFRSMKIEGMATGHPSLALESAIGPFPKLKNDPRVTTVGRLLRRTSMDELPQLLNVLRGEMSLVGPRPFIPDDAMWITDWAQRRYDVRPGITGLWQVSGRNNLTFGEMCRLDNLYVSSWSPGLDMRILVRTLRAIVVGSGAY